jgi:glutathione S-transferase
MKLYYAPGVCSIGIHVLLEEIGKPYDLQVVNLREGAQYKPEFTTVSAKSKVPALERDDGSILTEFPVIASYLAKTNPQAKLIPQDIETEMRAMEAMEYAVGTMHGQGFARIFRPGNFGPAEQEEQVKARGREMVEKGFAILDKALAGKHYLGGDTLSTGDTAVFYVEFWAAARLNMKLPPNVAAHYERMKSRPAVQRAMQQEGVA